MGKCTTWLYPFTRQAFAQCAYSRHLPFAFSSPCCAVFLPGQFLARLKEARRQIEIPNNGFFLSPSPGTRKNWNSRAWRGTLQAVQQRQIFPANVIKQAQLSSTENKNKLAGYWSAQILKGNPNLTHSSVSDPVSMWFEVKNVILKKFNNPSNTNATMTS